MKHFTLLNKKEIKKLNSQLKEQFGNEFDFSDYLVYRTPKDRIYIVSKDFLKINPEGLKIQNIGLYFLSIGRNGLRLSIDGTHLYKGKKNILELKSNDFREWMSGKDLKLKEKRGYFLLRYKNDFLGTGYSNGEVIKGYIPKERRVNFK